MSDTWIMAAFYCAVATCAGLLAYAAYDLRRCFRRRAAIRKALHW